MPSDLESRSLRFLATLLGAESLDDLLGDPKFDGQRRADYLLFGRRVILELKSLETDTAFPASKPDRRFAEGER
ncbi:hypothetical protein [Roseateles koreensis]|uniref:Uncharacterized protein n=1 Tax=Roseateles koreensis TaxID=2987526 RepID=A0ABT5KPF4_9BURK|nr:hypothetical protein [Roseateles koreensis]MDC8784799.1 hypothetical protein [Roseateles koreensis]